jgi:hypothetical protein
LKRNIVQKLSICTHLASINSLALMNCHGKNQYQLNIMNIHVDGDELTPEF